MSQLFCFLIVWRANKMRHFENDWSITDKTQSRSHASPSSRTLVVCFANIPH